MKDVISHRSRDDLWMAIQGKVYNVSEYVRDHPGGAEILLESGGSDATQAYHDVGHSEDADSILKSFCIGTVSDASKQLAPKVAVRLVQYSPPTKETKIIKGLLPILGLGTCGATIAVASVVSPSLRKIAADLLLHTRSGLRTIPAPHIKGMGGFTQGFSIAVAICSVMAGVVATQLNRITHIESGFTKYPAYVPYTKLKSQGIHTQKGFLDPKEYRTLPLVVKDQVAPSVFRLIFELPSGNDVVGIPIGQHVAIKGQVEGKAVSRSYTPTSNNQDRGKLELLIKCYPDGTLTGKYLAHLQLGDEVSFRGPKGPMRYHNGLCKRIGMIAGGTGITPMYQLIRAICEDDRDLTEVNLVYANRTEGDILLREELDRFARAYPRNLKVWYMLDQPPENWSFGSGYVTRETIVAKLPQASEDTKVMLCGPPGMVEGSKRALIDLGFKAPSSTSKMTDEIFLQGQGLPKIAPLTYLGHFPDNSKAMLLSYPDNSPVHSATPKLPISIQSRIDSLHIF
ncbi:hypothetical protein Q7P37_010344 [Cladosporium fusiforme]